MEQETAQELDGVKSRELVAGQVSVILPFKTSPPIFESVKPMVGNGDAMRVRRRRSSSKPRRRRLCRGICGGRKRLRTSLGNYLLKSSSRFDRSNQPHAIHYISSEIAPATSLRVH